VFGMEALEEIRRLKREKGALLLAHNYQLPEVQDAADFVGDSLELSLRAAETDARLLVFAGVRFMGETAALFGKRVLLPRPPGELGCDLADSVRPEEVVAWKEKNPNGIAVAYVNTEARVKAVSDYVCTSANCADVVRALPDVPILVFPDENLASYVRALTGKDVRSWHGSCRVHAGMDVASVKKALELHPGAEALVHPECPAAGDFFGSRRVNVASTGGMIKFVASSRASEFVVCTERDMAYRLKRVFPTKTFIPLSEAAVCPFMKKITLDDVLASLRLGLYPVVLEEDVAEAAKRAILRTFDLLGTPIEVKSSARRGEKMSCLSYFRFSLVPSIGPTLQNGANSCGQGRALHRFFYPLSFNRRSGKGKRRKGETS